MTQDLFELIGALRDELKQYGEMLALLDQQQQSAGNRSALCSLPSTAALHAQAECILHARCEREARRRALTRELRQDESASIPQLMPLLPPPFRPLLQSLVEENRNLFQQVQCAARENQALLSRSADAMQRFLELLRSAELEPVAA